MTLLITSSTYKRYKKSKGYIVTKESKNDNSRTVYVDSKGIRYLPAKSITKPVKMNMFNKLVRFFIKPKILVTFDMFNGKGKMISSNNVESINFFNHMVQYKLNKNYVLVRVKNLKK